MADITNVDLARLAGDNLEQASPDLLRATVKTFAEALMGAEAELPAAHGTGRVCRLAGVGDGWTPASYGPRS